jgi:DNA-binding MarR family transcriptional regulator
VSVAEQQVLRCLAEAPGPLSLTALAACTHRDVSSVSVLVQKLHARRLVHRRPDPDDRRRILLSPTPAGRGVLTATPDGVQTALARTVAAWPAARVRAATELLLQLTEGLTP